MSEKGPIYGVELIDTLPLGKSGGMLQAMPTRDDLCSVRCERVAAGYEVLLAHYLELRKSSQNTESALKELHAAIERGGLDISCCMDCGAPVVCIPDGLPMCDGCATTAIESGKGLPGGDN